MLVTSPPAREQVLSLNGIFNASSSGTLLCRTVFSVVNNSGHSKDYLDADGFRLLILIFRSLPDGILIRDQVRVQQARSFYRDIYNDNDRYFLVASRTQTWTTDTSPDTSYDNRVDMSQFRRDILFAKKVQNADKIMLARGLIGLQGRYMINMTMRLLHLILLRLVQPHYLLRTFMF